MLGSKELDQKTYSGRLISTYIFRATARHLSTEMRNINKLEDKKIIHDAKLGDIGKTKKDLKKLIDFFDKFEGDSKKAVRSLVKFENYELGKIQTLEEFLETLQKLGFPAGEIEADSRALLVVLEALKKDFKLMREHFAILEDKAGALIRQFEERQKSAATGVKVARRQARVFEGESRRAQRRLGRGA